MRKRRSENPNQRWSVALQTTQFFDVPSFSLDGCPFSTDETVLEGYRSVIPSTHFLNLIKSLTGKGLPWDGYMVLALLRIMLSHEPA